MQSVLNFLQPLEPFIPQIILGVILISLVLYIVLDGFDLGVGILTLFERDDEHKEEMMESIATVWDGNESWLVLMAAALFAGFPLAFGIVLPALYVPLILMLVALVFRGVAFEFQEQHEGYDWRWGLSFSLGSLIATLTQGVALGAFLEGFTTSGGNFTGGAFEFLTPFSLLTGLLLTTLYALSGAGWLAYKTSGELLHSSRRLGQGFSVATVFLLAAVVVSLLTNIGPAALTQPNSPIQATILTGSLIFAILAVVGSSLLLQNRDDPFPLLLNSLAMVALVCGFAAATYPFVVPPQITLVEAAAPTSSAALLLAFVVPLIPVTVAYNGIAYWVFRGKTPHSQELTNRETGG